MQTSKSPVFVSVWRFVLPTFLVPVLANVLALLWMFRYLPYLYPKSVSLAITGLKMLPFFAYTQFVSFPLIGFLSFFYVWPIFLHFYRESDYREATETTKRRIINMPMVFGLLTILGWFIGTVLTMGLYTWHTSQVDYKVYVSATLMSAALGTLSFVITYYTLDFFNRQWFLPSIFPFGGIMKASGSFRMSVSKKVFLFFYAVSVFPVSIWYAVVHHILSDPGGIPPGAKWDLFFLLLLFAFLSFWVSFLLGQNFLRPTRSMSSMARRVSEGDLDVSVPIVSNDEIGQLGESLNEMVRGLREKEKIKDSFGRLVDPKVRDYLLHGKLELGGNTLEATILFADIRDFTSLSENLNPKRVVFLLNKFFDAMSRCVTDSGGIVNKYIGDAILAIFGAPIALEDHVYRAVDAALRMRRELARLNRNFEANGIEPIRIGIGVHTGSVLSGNIGSAERLEYTVIGDTVNIASRLEGATKKIGSDLIISEAVFRAFDVEKLKKNHRGLEFQPAGRVKVKGKSEPISIYVPV